MTEEEELKDAVMPMSEGSTLRVTVTVAPDAGARTKATVKVCCAMSDAVMEMDCLEATMTLCGGAGQR